MFLTTDCPLKLDCATMTGQVGNCPNLTQCSSLRYLARRGDRPRFYYNRDWFTRDTIIFGAPPLPQAPEYGGGCRYFDRLTLDQLRRLVVLRFADPDGVKNSSPSTQEFLNFVQSQANLGFQFVFEGYAIHPQREDYRVTIDAIAYAGEATDDVSQAFQEFSMDADELEISPNYLRAWWD